MENYYSKNTPHLLGVIMGNLTIASIQRTVAEKDIIIQGMYSALHELTIAGSDLYTKDMTGTEIVEFFNKCKEKVCTASPSK